MKKMICSKCKKVIKKREEIISNDLNYKTNLVEQTVRCKLCYEKRFGEKPCKNTNYSLTISVNTFKLLLQSKENNYEKIALELIKEMGREDLILLALRRYNGSKKQVEKSIRRRFLTSTLNKKIKEKYLLSLMNFVTPEKC